MEFALPRVISLVENQVFVVCACVESVHGTETLRSQHSIRLERVSGCKLPPQDGCEPSGAVGGSKSYDVDLIVPDVNHQKCGCGVDAVVVFFCLFLFSCVARVLQTGRRRQRLSGVE